MGARERGERRRAKGGLEKGVRQELRRAAAQSVSESDEEEEEVEKDEKEKDRRVFGESGGWGVGGEEEGWG